MTIELDEPRNVRLPVYKREEIGLSLIGMLIRKEQRDVLRTDDAGQSVKDTNPKTGKPRDRKSVV